MTSYTKAYVDDPSIVDDDQLWRRIHPSWWVMDRNLGERRLSSAAFDDPHDGTAMSVDIARLRVSVEDALAQHDGYGLAAFAAKVARDFGQGIERAPLSTNAAHAEVFGSKTKKVRKQWAAASQVLRAPATPS